MSFEASAVSEVKADSVEPVRPYVRDEASWLQVCRIPVRSADQPLRRCIRWDLGTWRPWPELVRNSQAA